jgi:hypothetical protein
MSRNRIEKSFQELSQNHFKKSYQKKIALNLLMLLTATNEALSGKGVLNRTG